MAENTSTERVMMLAQLDRFLGLYETDNDTNKVFFEREAFEQFRADFREVLTTLSDDAFTKFFAYNHIIENFAKGSRDDILVPELERRRIELELRFV